MLVAAVIGTGGIIGLTWSWSHDLVRSESAGIEGVDFWYSAMLPAVAVCAIAIVMGAGGTELRGMAAAVVTGTAALLLVVATMLQPGLSVCTLPAAGVLAGAAIRGRGGDPASRIGR